MEETRMEEEDLEGPPPLDPYLEGLLARAEGGDDPRLCHPSHPTTTVSSGSSGMQSNWKPQNGG